MHYMQLDGVILESVDRFKKAVEYYTKAADQGHKDAQYS